MLDKVENVVSCQDAIQAVSVTDQNVIVLCKSIKQLKYILFQGDEPRVRVQNNFDRYVSYTGVVIPLTYFAIDLYVTVPSTPPWLVTGS